MSKLRPRSLGRKAGYSDSGHPTKEVQMANIRNFEGSSSDGNLQEALNVGL